MHSTTPSHEIPELYPLGTTDDALKAGLVGPAMLEILAAWNALEALETNLPGGPDRWQADSLFVARDGLRRAWLALSNLDHGLRRQAQAARWSSGQEGRQ